MIVESIEELQIIDVFDHGVPNRERVAIYVTDYCDLSDYCLLLGHIGVDGTATPIKDQLLWFGHGAVSPGDWIFIYTAAGSTTVNTFVPERDPSATNHMVSVHWGKDHTIFQNPGVVPMLIRIGGLATPAPKVPQYQGLPHTKGFRLK